MEPPEPKPLHHPVRAWLDARLAALRPGAFPVPATAERTRRAALVLILVGAACLRVGAVGLGNSALTFQIDEDHNVLIPLTLSWADLNPHVFYLPSVLWYLFFGLYRLVYWVGKTYGFVTAWGDLRGVFEHTNPLPFFLLARSLTAVLGTATVGVVYLVGRRLFSPAHGLLAAGFLGGTFLHVRDSALATTDAPTTLFVVLSLLGAAGVLQEGRGRNYVLAATAAGLAAATKYNAILIVLPLVVAHGVHVIRLAPSRRRLVTMAPLLGAGLLTIVVFVVLNAYLFLDWAQAQEDLTWAYQVFQEGRYLYVGPGYWYHFAVSLRYGMGLGLLGLALAGVVLGVWRREAAVWMLVSFAAPFYLVMGSVRLIYVRYMTPLLPVLCLFAAVAALAGTARLRWPRARMWAAAGVGSLVLVEPVYASVAYGQMVHHPDTRVEAYVFLLDSLRTGTEAASWGPSETWRSTIPRFWPRLYVIQPTETWTEVFTRMKADGVRYFLAHNSALEFFSPSSPELEATLRGSATLIRKFSPYRAGADPHPVYDWDDPYYLPIGGFRGMSRPGPFVRLYQLNGESSRPHATGRLDPERRGPGGGG